MDDADKRKLEFVIAQLRHAYAKLLSGTVVDQPQFARGLVGPQIMFLEKLISKDAS